MNAKQYDQEMAAIAAELDAIQCSVDKRGGKSPDDHARLTRILARLDELKFWLDGRADVITELRRMADSYSYVCSKCGCSYSNAAGLLGVEAMPDRGDGSWAGQTCGDRSTQDEECDGRLVPRTS